MSYVQDILIHSPKGDPCETERIFNLEGYDEPAMYEDRLPAQLEEAQIDAFVAQIPLLLL